METHGETMSGRYGGEIKGRRTRKTPWQISVAVAAEIGRMTRPDLEGIGATLRRRRSSANAKPRAKAVKA